MKATTPACAACALAADEGICIIYDLTSLLEVNGTRVRCLRTGGQSRMEVHQTIQKLCFTSLNLTCIEVNGTRVRCLCAGGQSRIELHKTIHNYDAF